MPLTWLSHWLVPSCPDRKESLPHMPKGRAHLFVWLQEYSEKLPLKLICLQGGEVLLSRTGLRLIWFWPRWRKSNLNNLPKYLICLQIHKAEQATGHTWLCLNMQNKWAKSHTCASSTRDQCDLIAWVRGHFPCPGHCWALSGTHWGLGLNLQQKHPAAEPRQGDAKNFQSECKGGKSQIHPRGEGRE